ncbi:aminodeoxychorismate synthase component I [Roseobacter denitrificans]|uniref:Para-aminobenzoate synthase, component I, putative n=1 Tax=Roseobacter denitrificans (strain ATCC 33942 / OCh 114) TaxID=375451 RepID=Q162G2_ROSDO|nr:para-aminobenzoate synthase, component I, putative [Roseobacter denitrificans OCh 114]AVL52495.1 aminodeoxychorismate synthase component I [Roseobacter denitrificans]
MIFDNGPLAGASAFVDPIQTIRADAPEDVAAAFAAMEQARAQGHWLAGYASYELGYVFSHKLSDLMPDNRTVPLLCFGVFEAPSQAQFDHPQVPARLRDLEPVWDEAQYNTAFCAVQDFISAGDVYQANLTFPLTARYDAPPIALYRDLCAKQPVPHGAFVDLGGPVLLSRSPELFFTIDDSGHFETKPMKGTAARGATPQADSRQRAWLRGSEKNQAENLMIVDLLRNDVSKLAKVGSVKVPDLFKVETYATLHQMTSRVTAQILPGTTLHDIFEALFPCGSITGAPKIRAMQIIRALENGARGAYCGSIGWIAPNGAMEFNVAIRTVICNEDGTATLNVGGGVVHDSSVGDEYAEAILKSRYAV